MIHKVAQFDTIKENETVKFILKEAKADREGFLIKKNNKIFAYYNECPHLGIALDWDDNDFLSHDQNAFVCKNHSAYFNISTGECFAGVCVKTALKPLKVQLENNEIFIESDL